MHQTKQAVVRNPNSTRQGKMNIIIEVSLNDSLRNLEVKHQNENRASPLRHIKNLSKACFKQVPAETAILVFYLVLDCHENVAISLNFIIFLKDNGRHRIWEISSIKFPLIL